MKIEGMTEDALILEAKSLYHMVEVEKQFGLEDLLRQARVEDELEKQGYHAVPQVEYVKYDEED